MGRSHRTQPHCHRWQPFMNRRYSVRPTAASRRRYEPFTAFALKAALLKRLPVEPKVNSQRKKSGFCVLIWCATGMATTTRVSGDHIYYSPSVLLLCYCRPYWPMLSPYSYLYSLTSQSPKPLRSRFHCLCWLWTGR